MNRRRFITASTLGACAPFLSPSLFSRPLQEILADPDEKLCAMKFEFAVSKNLYVRPINEVIIEIGKTFIGTEYSGHELEQQGEEKLVVNMRALDCVTFYENSLVLARCIRMKKYTFDAYKEQLQWIRYRGGKIDGYASRLHYTTDYWHNNEKKGVLKLVTKDLFGEKNVQPVPRPINFMTMHRDSYKQLADEKVFEKIKAMEDDLNTRETYFLPKGNLHMFADKIETGSLIGITTNVPGMDIAHTGIAIRLETGQLHFMHAPNVGHKVQITDVPLHDYLARNGKQTGIIVAKALNPV